MLKEIRNADDTLLGEIWVKDLGGKDSNEKAIAVFNRSDKAMNFSFDLRDAGFRGAIQNIQNLTRDGVTKTIYDYKNPYEDKNIRIILEGTLKPHAVTVYRIKAEGSIPLMNKDDVGEFKRKPLNKITLDDALVLQENGAVIVDVRSHEEFANGHLDGAVNIPYMDIHAIAAEYIPDKFRSIVVYCATGKRSSQAKNSLDVLGYKNVHYLGGLNL